MIKIKKLEKLKISGYIQAQMEVGQQFASTKVGQFSSYQENRDGKSGDFFRFGIRRGRIKVAWEESFGSAVFQLDITEKGLAVKDAYLKLSEPWLKVFSVTGGIFDRPFGDEVSYSSSRRETPERTMLFQNLFCDERDLGFMLTIAAPKGSAPEGLKLDIGAFSGNGIRPDDNGKMDLIAHLKYDKKWKNYAFGIGASAYYGTVNNSDTFIYKVENVDDVMKWNKTKVDANSLNIRQYYGIDAQFSVQTNWGISNLRGEVLFGTQPSQANSMMSPKANTYSNTATPAPSAFNYMRKFWGAHLYFVQDIYKTPLGLVLKYSYMDQNAELKGNEIKNKTDLSYHTFGVGLLYKITSYLRLMAYYDMPFNEKTDGITVVVAPTNKLDALDYSKHVKAYHFTLRLQFKF